MSTSFTHTFTMDDVSPQKALEVLISEDFEVNQQTIQPGTESARVKFVSRDEDTCVYELHAREYHLGMTGIDKTRTDPTVTYVTWDLKARKSAWTYEGPQAKRARVWGSTSVNPHGGGCQVTFEFNIDLTIPLVGRKIEGVVIGEAKKHITGNMEQILREMCQG